MKYGRDEVRIGNTRMITADKPYRVPHQVRQYVRLAPKVGANEPCTCGSGRKFKKCCGGVA